MPKWIKTVPRPPLPTLAEREQIIAGLLKMCRAGELNGVWDPKHIGVPIRRKGEFCGPPTVISWREAGLLAGVTIHRMPTKSEPKTLVRQPKRRRA